MTGTGDAPMVAPTTTGGGLDNADAKIVLARVRVASARLRLMLADIEEVGAFLAADRITPAGAIFWLHENQVFELCLTTAELAEVA